LVERRNSPKDRRSYALHLTQAGHDALEAIGRVSRDHQADVFAALTPAEVARMSEYLRRIAAQQGLSPGVHPALGRKDESG
ncbi:MarR family winged helix-turn-helix transcriptional regulator, partial [Singulisphaera rosea]